MLGFHLWFGSTDGNYIVSWHPDIIVSITQLLSMPLNKKTTRQEKEKEMLVATNRMLWSMAILVALYEHWIRMYHFVKHKYKNHNFKHKTLLWATY